MAEAKTYVWGVDAAIKHWSFGFAPSDRADPASIRVQSLLTPSSLTEGERLHAIYELVRAYAQATAAVFSPDVIWVEQPSGKFIKPQLYYAVGVVQVALFEATGVPVWSIPSGTWKKNALGSGAAKKADVTAWAAAHGILTASQDEADAACIAHAGRAMFTGRSWDAPAAA